jgi:Rho-binding antiterminator
MNRPYIPISCDVHDELLALATTGRPADLSFMTGSGTVERRRGRIVDVYTRGAAEYLTLDDDSTIRLDQLLEVNGVVVTPA